MAKFAPDKRVNCPHCKTTVKLERPSKVESSANWFKLISPENKTMLIYHSQCPECLQFIVSAEEKGEDNTIIEHNLWPQVAARDPIPLQIPPHIAQDYAEAAMILQLSPKASAALSRRCLQMVLKEQGGTTSKNLSDQIDEVLTTLPTHIAQNLDSIRVIGNFAAHPIKSQVTGAIIDVEPGEAEWNLDVLDALFDFYFVRPDLEQKKRDAINQKLQEAGKPPLKL